VLRFKYRAKQPYGAAARELTPTSSQTQLPSMPGTEYAEAP
jgi:hypothetical protein